MGEFLKGGFNLKLIKFRVKDFKSIEDSGEITCEKITNLIGVNEAGKSNVLLALWKLNPARGGEIIFTSDMPVSKVAEYRNNPEEHWFIEAWFKINNQNLLNKLVEISNSSTEYVDEFFISRNYDNDYRIDFYKYDKNEEGIEKNIKNITHSFSNELLNLDEAGKGEEGFKSKIQNILEKLVKVIDRGSNIEEIIALTTEVSKLKKSTMKTSVINPRLKKFQGDLKQQLDAYNSPEINELEEVRNLILENLPKFVYYANYGNLDSEIYLPRVIEDFKTERDRSEKALAKQRTLKVLFEYVNLDPEEILEMGQYDYRIKERNGHIKDLSEEQIKKGQEKTKEREILLNSASTKLTEGFRDWWKQGDYIFDLRADGDYFRIWVSDNKRPAKISLEDRSTGLQWFLSFYMVFLVESGDSHKNCILLLDEAGTSLHPLAQKDLLKFFENLSKENQILTTTHSPFLVDIDNLERTKVVFVDKSGNTLVSDDLRANEKGNTATGAVFAVHAALGLSISTGMLNGCEMVIVEGPSDQYYLNAIKQYLIANGKINPIREIIFMPAGGVKSVKQLTSLVAGKQNNLPVVILDSDKMGVDYKNKLLKDLYKGQATKIVSINDIVEMEYAEIEDLFPLEVMERPIERLINDRDFRFNDEYNLSIPIVPQIEEWAKEYDIPLEAGYKVQLAQDVKQEIARITESRIINSALIQKWTELFEIIISND